MAEATGSDKGKTRLSPESESLFGFYCELCKDDDKDVEATGFCVDCKEYLCDLCYSGHKRTRHTRYHVLLDQNTMPKDTPLSSDRLSKDISAKCKVHAGEPMKFYCTAHDVLGCSMCILTCHRKCPDIESVWDKSRGIFDSQEYTSFIETLRSLSQTSRDIIAEAHANLKQTKNCYSEIIESVKLLKEEVVVILDKLEQDLITEAETLVSKEEENAKSISDNCTGVTETIKNMLAEFQTLQSSRRVCHVYMSMKESGKNIKALHDNLRTTQDALGVKIIRFDPNRKWQAFINSPHALGSISSEVQKTSKRKHLKNDEPIQLETTHVTDIDTRSNGKRSSITGSVVLSKDRLVIVDFKNSKIKLLDTNTNKTISELEVDKSPWDATVINKNQVAVSVWDSPKILLLKASDSLTLDREITLDCSYTGVACTKDRLVVTCITPPRLLIMDLCGNVMKSVEYGNVGDGNQLFTVPYYVCISRDEGAIYVSDTGSNKIISLTLDGVVKCVYSNSELKSPNKVCVDHYGNVFVCGLNSRNVHVLPADLSKIQVILTQEHGLDGGVYSISHCQETDRLYVGMWNNVKMKVFQLS